MFQPCSYFLEPKSWHGDSQNGVDNVDPSTWFNMAKIRVGAMATRKTQGFQNIQCSHWNRGEGNLEIRKNFWSQRVTEEWNNLPNEVKSAETLDNFKNGIDNLLFEGTRGQR